MTRVLNQALVLAHQDLPTKPTHAKKLDLCEHLSILTEYKFAQLKGSELMNSTYNHTKYPKLTLLHCVHQNSLDERKSRIFSPDLPYNVKTNYHHSYTNTLLLFSHQKHLDPHDLHLLFSMHGTSFLSFLFHGVQFICPDTKE